MLPSLARRDFLRRLGLASLATLVVTPHRVLAMRVTGRAFPHPEPRPGVTAEHVLPSSRLPDKAAVRDAYAHARAYPAIFDGLYCACRCIKSHGHRSLLACFESDQPTGCLGCQEEAALAGRIAATGASLEAVRKAVDEEWG